MEVSKFSRCRRAGRQAGFSMIEMLFATVILTVGLVSLAGLISRTDIDTNKSRYSNTAAMLCSEKLEQLSGMRPESTEIKVAGNVAGSLSADASATVDGDQVSYHDTVFISVSGGSIRETTMGSNGQYMVTTQTPDGITEQKEEAVSPTVDPGTLTYKRRWMIEKGVAGLPSTVRRITVRVEYPALGKKPGILQMSMVRNAE